MADTSVYTQEDKACVNCKHMVKSYKFWPLAKFLLFGDDGQFYTCITPQRITRDFDNVTGKVTITKYPVPCRRDRMNTGRCEPRALNWEPSEKWRKRKENLFKQIVESPPGSK